MKASDLRERATVDLVTLRDQLRKDLFSARMKNFTGRLSDTSLIRKSRRDVARIEGILSARAGADTALSEGAQSSEVAQSSEGARASEGARGKGSQS